MRSLKKNFLMCLVVIFTLLTVSCDKYDKENKYRNSNGMKEVGLDAIPKTISVESFFPTKPGTRWVYEITLGETDPINSYMTIWVNGKSLIAYQSSRIFFAAIEGKSGDKFILAYNVKRYAPDQKYFQYPLSVEIEVEKDEFRIFHHAEQVFWAIPDNTHYSVMEVKTFSSNSPGSPMRSYGTPMSTGGYSVQMFMFGDSQGTGITIKQGLKNQLIYMGYNSDNNSLKFERRVDGIDPDRKTPEPNAGNLGMPYKEYLEFKSGKGLIKLKQVVNGKTSMTWRLVEFSKK